MPYTAEQIREQGFDFDAQKHVAEDISSSNTLFVAYPEQQGAYVPRIEGYKTKIFSTLDKAQQEAFMRLHEEFFYHRHNEFWKANALRRLPRLMASNGMLTCGEDLGMIPACVPDVMASERVLSLEIERMPKGIGVAFADTMSYPYLSVAATSTHDMSTIRGWWCEDKCLTQRYWNEVLRRDGDAEQECSGHTARMIIERHMLSSSMLAILPMQDWLAIDESLRLADPDAERINVPANPNHYWRYRMHLSVERLLEADSFNESISELVALR
jgi:4-alpha-glucanotransferase